LSTMDANPFAGFYMWDKASQCGIKPANVGQRQTILTFSFI